MKYMFGFTVRDYQLRNGQENGEFEEAHSALEGGKSWAAKLWSRQKMRIPRNTHRMMPLCGDDVPELAFESLLFYISGKHVPWGVRVVPPEYYMCKCS